MDKEKYQESLNDIIRNCKGFPCKNDSFYNMQELVDKSYIEYIGLEQQCKNQKEVIDKAKEWIYIVQNDKDNKHLEPIISTDELDELLDILKGEYNVK